MSLRRGDLVTVAAKGPYTSKPRPAVVQSSELSQVMADKLLTVPRSVLASRPFGRIGAADLERVDAALRFWLDL